MRHDFDGITFVIIGFLVTVPFAVWKWVEIIIWIVKHVHISIQQKIAK